MLRHESSKEMGVEKDESCSRADSSSIERRAIGDCIGWFFVKALVWRSQKRRVSDAKHGVGGIGMRVVYLPGFDII